MTNQISFSFLSLSPSLLKAWGDVGLLSKANTVCNSFHFIKEDSWDEIYCDHRSRAILHNKANVSLSIRDNQSAGTNYLAKKPDLQQKEEGVLLLSSGGERLMDVAMAECRCWERILEMKRIPRGYLQAAWVVSLGWEGWKLLGKMQWTAASSDISAKRERMIGNGNCEDLGSMSLNADFFPQFACLHIFLKKKKFRWGKKKTTKTRCC